MNLIFFLRSGSAKSREMEISEHAVLNQSPNFKGSENMDINKMSMQLNFCVSTSLILILLYLLKYWSCGIDIADRIEGKKKYKLQELLIMRRKRESSNKTGRGGVFFCVWFGLLHFIFWNILFK